MCFITIFSALSDVLVCHTCHKKIKIIEASKQGVEDVDSKMSLELCRKCEVNKNTFILL